MNNSARALVLLLAAGMTACGGGGGSSEPKNKPPVAGIVISPSSGAAPLAITASGSTSSDPDGTIASYAWEFGDGSSATGVQAQHTYANPGEFTVTLTVTDDGGKKATATGKVLATGTAAAYDSSQYDGATYLEEPTSGTLDTTVLK
jgi:PKD repeat protein